MGKVLVVANETLRGATLRDAVLERAQRGDSIIVVVPRTKPRSGYIIYDESVRDAAQIRIDLALSYLRSEGVRAEGEVGDEDPFTATLDAVDEHKPDELIVSTLPAAASGWLRRDLIERIEEATGLPVTHIVNDVDAGGLPFTVTLVVANQTASGDALLARMKEKAAEDADQLFIILVPQVQGDGKAAAAARARLGTTLDRMRREGLLVAGMIGDPDPYTATMNALQFHRVDAVLISTLPATRSGWLRADLIQRVRRSATVEVEHIEAERATAEAG